MTPRGARVLAAVLAGALGPGGPARAARPVESIEAEREAAAAELRDLDRRAASLDEQLGLRERLLRRRLRALYKLTQGGAVRILVEARDLDDLSERVSAAHRVLGRDLRELGALGEELLELGRDRARRADELGRAASLEDARVREQATPPVGLLRRRGHLPRPVPGEIVVGLARVRLREARAGLPPLELPRRAVDLDASAGEPVRAVAAGTVRWVGELEGIGRAVLVDHGDRYVSVTGRLGRVAVANGAIVAEGASLGSAAGKTVSFELSEGRIPLDPARWLRPPPPPPTVAAPRAATLAE